MNKQLINDYIEKIAAFMDVLIDDEPSYPEESPARYTIEQLDYNCDWSLLMPVVEKIESLNDHGFDFQIGAHGTTILCSRKKVGAPMCYMFKLVDATAAEFSFDKKIEHVFRACGIFLSTLKVKDGGCVVKGGFK